MKQVFDWHSEPDEAGGFVKGGAGKLSCMGGSKLTMPLIGFLVETPCCAIIEEMRSVLHDLYLHMEDFDLIAHHAAHTQSLIAEERKSDPRVEHARDKLQTADVFLAIFEKHLGTEWEITDDGSSARPFGQ